MSALAGEIAEDVGEEWREMIPGSGVAEEVRKNYGPRKAGEGNGKQHFGPETAAAVREVLDRVRQRLMPDYKLVAGKWKISPGALKQAVFRVRRGDAEVGLATTVTDLQASAAVEFERGARLCIETQQLLHDAWAKGLKRLQFVAKGQNLFSKYKAAGLPEIVAEAVKVDRLHHQKQAHLMRILREANREREVKSVVADVEASIRPADSLSEEAKAMVEVQKRMGIGVTEVDSG